MVEWIVQDSFEVCRCGQVFPLKTLSEVNNERDSNPVALRWPCLHQADGCCNDIADLSMSMHHDDGGTRGHLQYFRSPQVESIFLEACVVHCYMLDLYLLPWN